MSVEAARCSLVSLHEFVFSFLLAWLAMWHENLTARPIWRITPPWIETPMHGYWRGVSPEPAGVLDQVIWSCILGTVVFLLFRIYSKFRPREFFSWAVTGVVSIAGFPFFALLFPVSFFYRARIESLSFWLVLETVSVLICGTLYWIEKWPIGRAPNIALLVLHVGLWAWVTGAWPNPLQEIESSATKMSGVLISTLFFSGLPALSFLSTLTWGLCISGREGSYAQRGAAS